VKGSLVAPRVFFVSLAAAQSLVSDDVKHDTPGQVIKQGQSLHLV
jgi:hypothetical protein